MRASLALASLATVATFTAAQSTSIPLGYGRFPCSVVQEDGTLGPDASLCADDALDAPGLTTGNAAGTQGDGVKPTGAECVLQVETGAYYCGLAGAECTTSANCDNGHCVEGTCQGGFAQSCSGKDTNCLGFLYCLDPDYNPTASDTCGGLGAFCNDVRSASLDMTADEAQSIFDGFCQSGYCNFGTAQCDTKKLEGASCADDPTYGCATGLTCDRSSDLCVRAPPPTTSPSQPGASQRARARSRRASALVPPAAAHHPGHARGGLCPAGTRACALAGAGVGGAGGGLECVDVLSSLEQCGSCAGQGGVDCTAIAHVGAVGCVQGVCEVWACEDGFAFDAQKQACVVAA